MKINRVKLFAILFMISIIVIFHLYGQIKSLNLIHLSMVKNEMSSYYSALFSMKNTILQEPMDSKQFIISKIALLESGGRLNFLLNNLVNVPNNRISEFTQHVVDNVEKAVTLESQAKTEKEKILKQQIELIDFTLASFKIEEIDNLNMKQIESRMKRFFSDIERKNIID